MKQPGREETPGMMFTVPCPTCVERARKAYNWRTDPAFGTCPVCSDLLTIDANGELEPCDNVHTREVPDAEPEYGQRAGIPARYMTCRIGTWEPQRGYPRQQVAEFVRSWPPENSMLLLYGAPGTGKTHLAIGAIFEARQRHGSKAAARFFPVVDLLERFRRTMDADRATESVESIEASFRRTPLLVLDDFGAHKSTEWAEERLFKLVDERYRERRPLIVTTNLALANIEERLKSRLLSGGKVFFDGVDRRRSA